MRREFHVRFCEGGGVRFPSATRLVIGFEREDDAKRVMSRARLIVFDLDGTLVDSRRDLAESANALLAEYGCPALDEHAIGRMVGDGAATLVARALAAAGCPPATEALPRFLAIYNGRLLRCTRAYPGVPELLEHLAARAALAVLTNKPLAATRQILEGLDLARRTIAKYREELKIPTSNQRKVLY